MTPEPIHYNYMALLQGVVWLVLLAVIVIIAINYRWWPRGNKWLSAWLREKQGDILPVLFLFATAGIGWLYVWAKWILTHEPE